MKLILLKVLVLLTISLASAKKKTVIDGNLQKLRQDYREFRLNTKLQLDKSFFDIYNAIDSELLKLQKPFLKSYEKWSKTCSKFPLAVVDDEIEGKFKSMCKNADNLLQNSLKIHQKGLNKFFAGDLTSLTPPLEFFEDLSDEIEIQIEEIWRFYVQKNSTCVAMMFDSFFSLFTPTIDEVIKLGKITAENVARNDFVKSGNAIKMAINEVEKVIDEISLCVSVKDINSCIRKLVKKLIKFSEISINFHHFLDNDGS